MIFLYGEEKYFVQQRLKELKGDFIERNAMAEVVDFDLEEDDFLEMFSGLTQGSGLFGGKRLFIVRGALSLDKKFQKKIKDFLVDRAEATMDELELIFVEVDNKKSKLNSVLGRYLKKTAEVEEFQKKRGAELQQWVTGEFLRRSNKKVYIDLMAVRELIFVTAEELWRLNNEIDKLINYREQGEITVEDVRKIVVTKTEVKIFDLVDAIGSQDKRRALLLKNQLLEQGDNEFYVFTMILFQIRNLLKVADCLQKGIKLPAEIKKITGLHPFVIQKTIKNLQRYSLIKIKRIYQMVAELDRRTKTGEMKMNRAMEWLIIRI